MFLGLIMPMLIGCPTVDCNDAEDQYDTLGRISGVVTDENGDVMPDVLVEVGDIATLTSDNGDYTLEGVTPSEDILVKFSSDNTTETYRQIDLHGWETATANAVLMDIDHTQVINAVEGGTVTNGDVSISFPENAFGEYDGEVTISFTYFDPYEDNLMATPGDLSGLALTDDNTAKSGTEPTSLVSYGMLNVQMSDQNGDDIQLVDGVSAGVSMPITNGELADTYHLGDGSEAPTWHFDTQNGTWLETGVGVVSENDEGELTFTFEANEFSWWNCDQGYVPSCAFGNVIDMIEFPIRSAEVVCQGAQSTSVVTTDEGGNFVCDIMVGDTVSFTASSVVNGKVYTATKPSVFMDGAGSSAADCEDVDKIKIDVCRIAGNINVSNLQAQDGNGNVGDHDQFSAHFWDPQGDPEQCRNPWWELEMDTCMTYSAADKLTMPGGGDFSGIEGSRSVGDLTIMFGNQDVEIEEKITNERNPYYSWTTHSVDGTDIEVNDLGVDEDDAISIQTDGNPSYYFDRWEQSSFVTIPEMVEWDNHDALETEGGNVTIKYDGSTDDPNGVIVMAIAPDSAETTICRVEDDGNATIELPRDMSAGEAAIMVYHSTQGYLTGPDGLPIFFNTFSGQGRAMVVK